jgi:hypothetical protein
MNAKKDLKAILRSHNEMKTEQAKNQAKQTKIAEAVISSEENSESNFLCSLHAKLLM